MDNIHYFTILYGKVIDMSVRPVGQNKSIQPAVARKWFDAVRGQQIQTVKDMVTIRGLVNATNEDGDTALIIACYQTPLTKKLIAIVNLLVESGASVNHASHSGNTALTHASLTGFVPIVRLLLDAGAHVNHTNNNGDAPLRIAVYYGHTEVVALLIDAHADLYSMDKTKGTLLWLAAERGFAPIVQELVKAGVNVDQETRSGDTALTIATTRGDYPTVKILLEAGADYTHINNEGMDALDIARKMGFTKIAELIMGHRQSNTSPLYRILGDGGFGMVVGPALPNRNNVTGNVKEFPSNVTKIYETKDAYEKAIQDSEWLQEKFKDVEVQMIPYHRSYLVKNLDKSIRRRVHQFLKRKEAWNLSTPLYLLRTPYLGYSAHDISQDENKIRMLRTIPYQTICKQIYKCMKVVKAFYDASYVHADIRETNVLCRLDTGAITIIDFDLLHPINAFFGKWKHFFYSHPPESLYIWKRTVRTVANKAADVNPYSVEKGLAGNNKIYSLKDLSCDNTVNLQVFEQIRSKHDVFQVDEAADGATYLCNKINEDIPRADSYVKRFFIYELATPSFDSYGLALSLDYLLKGAWMLNANDAPPSAGTIRLGEGRNGNNQAREQEHTRFLTIREFLKDKLLPMMRHGDISQRWNIMVAMEEWERVLAQNGIDVEKEVPSVVEELERMKEIAGVHAAESNNVSPANIHVKTVGEQLKALNDIQRKASATENAASVAGLMLTTECAVSDKPEPAVAAPAMPGGGDMGGMGGMM